MTKKRVEAPKTVEAYAYFCPHFQKMVNCCTCHERPAYKVADPLKERVYKAALKWHRTTIEGASGVADQKAHAALFRAVEAALKKKG